MKKTIYRSLLALVPMAMGVALGSCDDKLDIIPRQLTTLYTVEDVGALLNKEWRVYDFNENRYEYLCGNMFPYFKSVGEVANIRNTEDYALVFGDEGVDRVALCDDDYQYTEIYQNIKYCNIAVDKMPSAEGNEALKPRFIAQGRILRAWFHFLAANIYAAQYDPSTAASLGGIAYVDNINNGETKEKLSLAATYERILGDCTDELIACLSHTATDDPFRFEADFGYGVRASVLFQMKRYAEAAQYARKALEVNPVIADLSQIVGDGTWLAAFGDPNNYMFILSNYNSNMSELGYKTLTPQWLDLCEQGDYRRYYSDEDEWMPWEENQKGPQGSMIYYGRGAARINQWGLRAEQMYYILAESLIRQGRIDDGLDYVDQVRRYRIHPQYFRPFKGTVSTEAEAMALLDKAKRVECIYTFQNFLDRKRRNSEPAYAAPVVHELDEFGTVTIRPDSPLWIFPFPMNATNYNPTLTQNI